MSRKNLDLFPKEVIEALDRGQAKLVINTQSKLSASSPVDSGRLASSWFVSKDQPDTTSERDKDWANLDPEWLFHMSLYQAGARDFSHVILSCMAMEMHKSKYLLGLPTVRLKPIAHVQRPSSSPILNID